MVSELLIVKGNEKLSQTVRSTLPKCSLLEFMPSDHPDDLCKRCEEAINQAI